jgi:hypothetical protein
MAGRQVTAQKQPCQSAYRGSSLLGPAGPYRYRYRYPELRRHTINHSLRQAITDLVVAAYASEVKWLDDFESEV